MNLEKRNYEKFFATVPYHIKATKIKGMEGFWLKLPHGLFKVVKKGKEYYYRENVDGKIYLRPLVVYQGRPYWNSERMINVPVKILFEKEPTEEMK